MGLYGYTLPRTAPVKRIIFKYIDDEAKFIPVSYTDKLNKKVIQLIRQRSIAELVDDDSCIDCPKCGTPFRSPQVFKLHYQHLHMRKAK